jgi:Ca2+-binding RTX toxin-like protein
MARRTLYLPVMIAAAVTVTCVVTLVVASGVPLALNKLGTNGPDILRGTNKSDNLLGRSGGDDIYGWGGTDNLQGGPGKDFVFGGKRERFRFSAGNKNLLGGTGNDFVNGGLGSDNVVGQKGNDLLDGGRLREYSIDVLSGGEGGEVIFVHNYPAAKDIVFCGDGRDQVLADRADVLAPDCERAVVVHGSLEDVERQEAMFYDSIQEFFKGIRFPGL